MRAAPHRLEALNRRLDNINAALTGYLDQRERMTLGGQELLERTTALFDFTRQALNHRWGRTTNLSEPIREHAQRRICDDFAAVLLELSTSLLPALEGALSARVPIELEPALQDLAERANPSAKARITLYASEALNYSIEGYADPVTQLAPRLAPSLPVSAPLHGPFLFLRIPLIERDSATLHIIILAHEIGHWRDWSHHITEGVLSGAPTPAHWQIKGKLLLGRSQDNARYQFLIRRWCGELVADTFATLLFGPAALWALNELFASLGTWKQDSLTHPAPDRRVSAMVTDLTDRGFANVPELSSTLADAEAECTGALTRGVRLVDHHASEADNLAWTYLTTQLPGIRAACQNAITTDEEMVPDAWTDVEQAAAILEDARPCGEIAYDGTVNASPYSVSANAAWLVRLRGSTKLGSALGLDSNLAEERSQIGAVLDDLLLKSFEVADIRRERGWP